RALARKHKHLAERDGFADLARQFLDRNLFSGGDAILLPAGLHDCEHLSLPVFDAKSRRAAAPRSASCQSSDPWAASWPARSASALCIAARPRRAQGRTGAEGPRLRRGPYMGARSMSMKAAGKPGGKAIRRLALKSAAERPPNAVLAPIPARF